MDRLIEKRWQLAELGDPKRVLQFLGKRLATFSRKIKEPSKEPRTVLGKEMLVCVYPAWWWEKFGDGIVECHLRLLRERPELLARILGEKKS